MAVSTQIIRVKNPRRRRKNLSSHRMFRNKKGRFVKLSRVKAVRTRKKKSVKRTKRRNPIKVRYTRNSRKRASNTRTRRVKRTNKRHTRRVRNPLPILIELGAVNPRRRKHVARKRKSARRNPRRRRVSAVRVNRRRRVHHRRRRRNPVAVAAPRRRNTRRRVNRRHRHYGRRRRNPMLPYGRSSGKDLLMMVGGGLVGVAATKYLPTLIPSSLTSSFGTSAIVSVLMTGAGAFVAGWLAGKLDPGFGQAVLFGGLMQTGSSALNAFIPNASILGQRLALSGVGDIVPTGPLVMPGNQFKTFAMPAPINAGMSGFRTAFGGRR